jgi:hypothetical protein
VGFDTFLKCMGGVAPRCILTGMYEKIQFVLYRGLSICAGLYDSMVWSNCAMKLLCIV